MLLFISLGYLNFIEIHIIRWGSEQNHLEQIIWARLSVPFLSCPCRITLPCINNRPGEVIGKCNGLTTI